MGEECNPHRPIPRKHDLDDRAPPTGDSAPSGGRTPGVSRETKVVFGPAAAIALIVPLEFVRALLYPSGRHVIRASFICTKCGIERHRVNGGPLASSDAAKEILRPTPLSTWYQEHPEARRRFIWECLREGLNELPAGKVKRARADPSVADGPRRDVPPDAMRHEVGLEIVRRMPEPRGP